MATTDWQNARKTRRCKVDKRGKTTRENMRGYEQMLWYIPHRGSFSDVSQHEDVHQKVENSNFVWGHSGAIESTGRSLNIRVGSKRLSRLRRGLSDERVNNNTSSEVDNVCRGATERRMTFVIRSGSIHQLIKHHPNNKIRVYQYQFRILSFNIYIGCSAFKRMDNELR
jgi:hypothetical protein